MTALVTEIDLYSRALSHIRTPLRLLNARGVSLPYGNVLVQFVSSSSDLRERVALRTHLEFVAEIRKIKNELGYFSTYY